MYTDTSYNTGVPDIYSNPLHPPSAPSAPSAPSYDAQGPDNGAPGKLQFLDMNYGFGISTCNSVFNTTIYRYFCLYSTTQLLLKGVR